MELMDVKDRHSEGFTLIEVIVVMGILAIVGGGIAFVGMNDYRSYLFRGDQDLVLNVLHKARSQAVNNVCLGSSCSDGQSHGAHFQPGQYVIFQGGSFNPADPQNEAFPISSPNFSVKNDATGNTNFDIVFNKLDSAVGGNFILDLTDSFGHSSQVSISTEGRVDW
jgi:prepilin-type N-terminal cleavage/methylation domain-containing protein